MHESEPMGNGRPSPPRTIVELLLTIVVLGLLASLAIIGLGHLVGWSAASRPGGSSSRTTREP